MKGAATKKRMHCVTYVTRSAVHGGDPTAPACAVDRLAGLDGRFASYSASAPLASPIAGRFLDRLSSNTGESLTDAVRRSVRDEFSLRDPARKVWWVNANESIKLRRLSDRQIRLLRHLANGVSNARHRRLLSCANWIFGERKLSIERQFVLFRLLLHRLDVPNLRIRCRFRLTYLKSDVLGVLPGHC